MLAALQAIKVASRRLGSRAMDAIAREAGMLIAVNHELRVLDMRSPGAHRWSREAFIAEPLGGDDAGRSNTISVFDAMPSPVVPRLNVLIHRVIAASAAQKAPEQADMELAPSTSRGMARFHLAGAGELVANR